MDKYRPAIIDTGAPLSLLPRSVWIRADIARFRVGGLVRKSEAVHFPGESPYWRGAEASRMTAWTFPAFFWFFTGFREKRLES
jgi:hypothetical protein